jgi:hypothetical protein
MIKAEDLRILTLQISVFSSNSNFATGKILSELSNKYGDVFDSNPTSIPLPKEAPPDLPRLILSSSDKKMKLEISANRANLFRYRTINDTVIDPKGFLDFGLEVFKDYIKYSNSIIGRLAIVSNRFIEDDNPALRLAKHFCKEKWIKKPFNRPESFEIHSHKVYQLGEFTINSWVRCKSGSLKNNNKPIVIVEQDINTLSDELDKKSYQNIKIKKFAGSVIKEQKEILNKYFPSNE